METMCFNEKIHVKGEWEMEHLCPTNFWLRKWEEYTNTVVKNLPSQPVLFVIPYPFLTVPDSFFSHLRAINSS